MRENQKCGVRKKDIEDRCVKKERKKEKKERKKERKKKRKKGNL
jgi:hypothetical protein